MKADVNGKPIIETNTATPEPKNYMEWWNGLKGNEKKNLCSEYYPSLPYTYELAKDNQIDFIYECEQMKKADAVKEPEPFSLKDVDGFTGGNWEVWEDYERDAKPEKNPCFSIRSFGGSKIIAKSFQNIDEPPASKTAYANFQRIVTCVNNFDSLKKEADTLRERNKILEDALLKVLMSANENNKIEFFLFGELGKTVKAALKANQL